jgi:hypothetical protein
MDGPTPAAADPFEASVGVVREANARGIPLKLLGGQAVRLLCPLYPHRARDDQDMDFACISSKKREVIAFFAEQGFLGDPRFNTLHGDRQMYFTTADGKTSVDVVMDRLRMCHELEFGSRIERMPDTLDVADLLLSKLQIVELNEKDAADAVQLLGAYPVRAGDDPGTIGLARFDEIVGDDWGWWRTVTATLERIRSLATGDGGSIVPPSPPFDPVEQVGALLTEAERVPKSRRWRLRSLIGERIRWYELPEEEAHD